jgi:hypothetical protein
LICVMRRPASRVMHQTGDRLRRFATLMSSCRRKGAGDGRGLELVQEHRIGVARSSCR